MRTARLLGEGRSFYHCMSRVVDRTFIFGGEEKEYFRETMRKLEAFLEVRVVTYCLMSNHFHVLLDVPDPEEIQEKLASWSDEDLLQRLSVLYSEEHVAGVSNELNRLRFAIKQDAESGKGGKVSSGSQSDASGYARRIEQIRAGYLDRIGSMACFMQSLKQRFSSWYNRREGRRGTLWEERYKSVLVEGSEDALFTVAAYIDLNPVRAKLVDDPKDYHWSGYGEAVGSSRTDQSGILAQERLAILLEYGGEQENCRDRWKKVAAAYRLVLFGVGEERRGIDAKGHAIRAGFSRAKALEVWKRGGELSLPQVLRCRVRYFSDGVVVGAQPFVERLFERNRSLFGPRRKSGSRTMKGAEWGELRVIRDLRRKPIA